jgi:hypothetical protein
MPQADRLEAPGEAFGEPALNEERRRAEQHDAQLHAFSLVLVPEPLHGLRPAVDLLHFVENEDGVRGAGSQARRLPLRRDPLRPAQGRLVRTRGHDRAAERVRHLLDERRLPDLPRPHDDLHETPRLGEPGREDGRFRSAVG